MAYQLWTSFNTGKRRNGTTFKEIQNVFINHLTTKFICEPLLSCKKADSSLWVKEELEKRELI